jgi:CBS domain-containing protein
MRVEHIMSLNPVACESDQPCQEAAALMRDRATGCVVVLENERVVGLLTDRMLATELVAGGLDGDTPVSDVMVREVACLSPDDSVFAACDTMRSAHLARRVPVIGPGRELLGIVSISDIAVVAQDLIDAVLAEDTQHSLKRARVLTGAKRFVKRLRRPTKVDRLPAELPALPKRRASRPGLVRNPIPRSIRRMRNPAVTRNNARRGTDAGRREGRAGGRARRPGRGGTDPRSRGARRGAGTIGDRAGRSRRTAAGQAQGRRRGGGKGRGGQKGRGRASSRRQTAATS